MDQLRETTLAEPTLRTDEIDQAVRDLINSQPVLDIHTHLYPPAFGSTLNPGGNADASGLMLWGVDELITYHYLIAEVFRVLPPSVLPYETFWRLSKSQQADHIWKWLFVERTPVSEACRGVLTSLQLLGLDPNEPTLDRYRSFFREQSHDDQIDRVMRLANVSSITMTNDVFNDEERRRWLANPQVGRDPRFRPVLRIDSLVTDYGNAARKLNEWGYPQHADGGSDSVETARQFLRDWIKRIDAAYVAVSLAPDFRYPRIPSDSARVSSSLDSSDVLRSIVLPVCAERGLPFAMMIGSRRGVNPQLKDAGDMGGLSDVQSVVNICREFPENKFLVTMLSRENQHELCVTARKFANLMIFGCWWFLNNPSIIDEIERMRFELLGTSFIPQHSDARILEQLLYKWTHSRAIIARVLADKYRDLAATGFRLTRQHIRRDLKLLFEQNAVEFLDR